MIPALRFLAAAALLVLLGGCSNIGYYVQSVRGQLDIWWRERPIEALLADPGTPPVLKEKLTQVQKIRGFASTELDLPLNGSYTRYADLERPYAIWNVFAAPEFSMKLRQWCFPFAGCVSYRGYFSRVDAEQFAATLGAQGNDIYVGGVPAYSTLGWFADPVLNTFIHYPDYRIAQLIFHELAHQKVYAANDTMFNESFAVVVEREGLRRWLARHGSDHERLSYERERQYREEFVALARDYHRRLEKLYDRALSNDRMKAEKNRILEAMLEEHERLKTKWGGYTGYDAWFARRPNNAQIASVALYTRLVPGFEALLRWHGGDLPRFYAAVEALAALPEETRTERLEQLIAGAS